MKRQFIHRASANHIRVAVVGFPNVGKTGLFNAFQGQLRSVSDNGLFTTIDPSAAVIRIEDERLDWFSHQLRLDNVFSSYLTAMDSCGVVLQSFKGEGVGLDFLEQIQSADVLAHILRAFTDVDITHYDETVDPVRDLFILQHELMMKDIEIIEMACLGIEPDLVKKLGGLQLQLEYQTLCKAWSFLAGSPRPETLLVPEDDDGEDQKKGKKKKKKTKDDKVIVKGPVYPAKCEGRPIRLKKWTSREIEILEKYRFYSAKEVICLVNLSERDYLRSLPGLAAKGREHSIVASIKMYYHEYESSGFAQGRAVNKRHRRHHHHHGTDQQNTLASESLMDASETMGENTISESFTKGSITTATSASIEPANSDPKAAKEEPVVTKLPRISQSMGPESEKEEALVRDPDRLPNLPLNSNMSNSRKASFDDEATNEDASSLGADSVSDNFNDEVSDEMSDEFDDELTQPGSRRQLNRKGSKQLQRKSTFSMGMSRSSRANSRRSGATDTHLSGSWEDDDDESQRSATTPSVANYTRVADGFRASTVLPVSTSFETKLLAMKASQRENKETMSQYDEYFLANPTHKSAMPRLIDEVFRAIGMIRFYTIDPKLNSVRVWNLRKGSNLVEAAALLDIALSRTLLRCEVVNYDDLHHFFTKAKESGSEYPCCLESLSFAIDSLRLEGLARSQGVKYVVNDGDLLEFVQKPQPKLDK